jgi:hypothetical protein
MAHKRKAILSIVQHIKALSLYAWSLLFVLVIFYGCAKVIAPEGGTKDETPPELIQVHPPMGTTNFAYKRIELRFDEFFTLKSPQHTIFLNPLSDNELKHQVRGKRLIISLTDTLRPNLTYSLVFDNAIADFNEGNLLPELRYVFSTGNSFDTMGLKGKVLSAETSDFIEGVKVYLLPADADSILLKKQFSHVANVNSAGLFHFNHLPKGNYKLYALLDKDNNHIYNTPNEMIGFYGDPIKVETIQIDDTTRTNTVSLEKPLMVFQDADTIVRVSKLTRVRKGLHHIAFNIPVQSATAKIVGESVADSVFYTLNSVQDTLSVWFIKHHVDFAKLEITANEKILDTVSVSLKSTGRGGSADDYLKPVLKASNVFDGTYFHHSDTIIIRCNNPIKQIKQDSVFLISGNDTLEKNILFDKSDPLKFSVVFSSQAAQSCSLEFLQNSVIDFFNNTIDSVVINLQATDTTYYGSIRIQFDPPLTGCHIIEIAGARSSVKYQYFFENPEEDYFFDKIIPGDYIVRLIVDENCNRKWDTGNFEQRKQAEAVYKLPGTSIVKSTWETEIIWSIE